MKNDDFEFVSDIYKKVRKNDVTSPKPYTISAICGHFGVAEKYLNDDEQLILYRAFFLRFFCGEDPEVIGRQILEVDETNRGFYTFLLMDDIMEEVYNEIYE